MLNECTCPGPELRLQCTVVGGGFTVWRGSAFSGCSNNVNHIQLRHTQFERGTAVGECNDGMVVGHGVKRVGLNYTSQLVIHLDVNSTLEGRTVECVYNDGTYEMVIDTYSVISTRGETVHVIVCIYYIVKLFACSVNLFYVQIFTHLLTISM